MPQAVPLLAGYVVAGWATAGTYLTGAALTFATAAIGGVVAWGTARVMGLDEMPGLPEPGATGNVRSTVQPIPIIYGRRRVGGVIAQMLTTGKQNTVITLKDGEQRQVNNDTDNKFMNIVLCWGEGEIEGVQEIYFNDIIGTIGIGGRFDGFYQVQHFVGTNDQPASTLLLAALANTFATESAARLWSTAHKLSGIAYSYFKLEHKAEIWPAGIPNITVVLKGRKILDLRTGVWAWSENPALIIYDYITNARFGRGIAPADIDTQSFIDAANYCDQEIFITLTPAVPPDVPLIGVIQKRYACDVILNPDVPMLDNLRTLLATCRGALVFSGGKYQIKIDKPETPSFALTEDNIVGGWGIVLENSEGRYNRVIAQWPNPAQRDQDDYVTVASPEFLAADNGVVSEVRVDLPATRNIYRARQLAGMILRQSRHSLRCEVLVTIAGLTCEIFDVVTVTHEVPGWDGQLFRVIGISMESDDTVRLQLMQYADEVYDLDSQNQEDSEPPTYLPDPRFVPPPAPETIDLDYQALPPDFIPRANVLVAWRMDSGLVTQYIVSYRARPRNTSGTGYGDWGDWQQFTIDNLEERLFSPPPPLGADFTGVGTWVRQLDPLSQLEYRVKAVNSLGVQSEWSAVNQVNVPGDATPPATPTNLRLIGHPNGIRLSWTAADTREYVRYQVWRVLAGEGFAFTGATLIATITGTNYLDPLPPGTLGGYWVRPYTVYGTVGVANPATNDFPIGGYAGLQTYASDAAAGAAGLVEGDLYKDGSGNVKVKL